MKRGFDIALFLVVVAQEQRFLPAPLQIVWDQSGVLAAKLLSE